MSIAVGSDIVQISRVEALTKQGRLERMLRPEEIARSSPEHIGGRIALKEAAIKALGLTADDWLQVIIRQNNGKPTIDLIDAPKNIESIDCSISHDGDYAFAVVVVLYS